MSSKSKLPFVLGSIYDMYVDRSRYIEALCPRAWKVYGNESTVQTCVDQILTLQRDARAGVPLMVRSDRCMRLQRPISTPLLTHVLSALILFLAPFIDHVRCGNGAAQTSPQRTRRGSISISQCF